MKFKQIFTALLMVLLVVPLTHGSDGQDLKICVFPMNPLNFIDNEGTAQGLYPDLLREIVREEEWKITFIPGSWGECYDRVQKREIDLITTIGFSKERAKIFSFNSEPVADIWGRVYSRPDSQISNIADLEGQKVAIARKDINGKNFIKTAKKLGIAPEIIELNNHHDIFSAIQKGEVVAGVVPQHFGFREAKKFNLVPSTIEFEPFSVYIAAKKGFQEDTLARVDEHLKSWKKDPASIYYKKIDYWLGGKSEDQGIPQWVYIVIYSSFGGLILLTVLNSYLKREVRRRINEIIQKESRFKSLAETTKAVPWELDIATQKFNYVGPRIEDLLGYPIDSWVDMQSWSRTVHPDDRKWAIDFCTVETSQGKDHDFVYQAVHADGRTIWVHDIVSVQMGSNGPEKLYGYFVDITEQKRLQSQMIRSSQLASLGELAAGVAHEINNPIGGVINYAQLILNKANSDSIEADLSKRIIKEGDRIATIVKQLLSFSRQGEIEHKLHDIQLLIDVPLALLGKKLEHDGIIVEVSIDENIGQVNCNAQQIEQVLLNLISNAQYALDKKNTQTKEEKKIQITAKRVMKENSPFMLLEVKDYGIGIPEDVLPKIFNTFYTTKEIGTGTGLGLNISESIMELHGGKIEVDSVEGEYTKVTIKLPM